MDGLIIVHPRGRSWSDVYRIINFGDRGRISTHLLDVGLDGTCRRSLTLVVLVLGLEVFDKIREVFVTVGGIYNHRRRDRVAHVD